MTRKSPTLTWLPLAGLCAFVAQGLLAEGPGEAQAPLPVPPPRTGQEAPAPDLAALLRDFAGADQAAQARAAGILLALGGKAYRELREFVLHSSDKPLAARAQELSKRMEARERELAEEARARNIALNAGELSLESVQAAKLAYERLAAYALSPKQGEVHAQQVVRLRIVHQQLLEASKELAQVEARLNAPARPAGPIRAALRLKQAQQLTTLRRLQEAFRAVEDGLQAAVPESPLYLELLGRRVDLLKELKEDEQLKAACAQLIEKYPESFQAQEAFETLLDRQIQNQQNEALLQTAQAYLKAHARSRQAQEKVLECLEVLFDSDSDYPRAAALAAFLEQQLPRYRVPFEALRIQAVCQEYVLKDPARAKAAYQGIAGSFRHETSEDAIRAALGRVERKAAGTFPREPGVEDAGPAGALARFLVAVRRQDEEALKLAAATEGLEELKAGLKDLAGELVFCDLIVERVEGDEKGGQVQLVLAQYLPGEERPAKKTVKALRQQERWRILWPLAP